MPDESSASILYLNTIYSLDEKFRIMIIPDLGDIRKKQEVIEKSHSYYEVLIDEIGAVYHFYETVRSDSQKRAVSISQFFEESKTQLEDIHGETNMEKLETIGKKIYDTLFPDQIKKYLEQNPIDTIVLLSTDYLIPYELMHDGKSFLATKIDFYRSPIIEDVKQVEISEKAQKEPGLLAIVANPTGDLEAAERESSQIVDFFKAKKNEMDLEIELYSQKGASYRALSKIFASPRLDIFHYSGHSGANREDIYFHLPDDPFSVIDLYLQYPALFFLNMCESDIKVRQQVHYQGVQTLNFPMAVMRRGAKGCLATLWPIVDASAAQFAVNFYKNLLKGEPFGTSIRKAKEYLANISDPNDITWASFIMYGSPGFSTVKIPKKEAPAESEAPTGLAVYLSYSKQDAKEFHISEITRSLEMNPMVHKVFDHVRDFTSNVPAYMNEYIPQSDALLVFCGNMSQQSWTMKEEINAALRHGIEIIPICIEKRNVPIILRTRRLFELNTKNIQSSIQQLRMRLNMIRPRRT